MAEAPLVDQFQCDIDAVVDKYREQGISIAETVGALTVTVHNLIEESTDDKKPF